MLAVYVWHTVIPRFPNLPKTSDIAVVSKTIKKGRQEDTKRLLKEFEKGCTIPLMVASHRRQRLSSGRHCPGEALAEVYLQGRRPQGGRTPGVSVQSGGSGLARADPTRWSRTGASCTPVFRLVTWCRESAVLGWSSSCQIFSCSSFSSSFCG